VCPYMTYINILAFASRSRMHDLSVSRLILSTMLLSARLSLSFLEYHHSLCRIVYVSKGKGLFILQLKVREAPLGVLNRQDGINMNRPLPGVPLSSPY